MDNGTAETIVKIWAILAWIGGAIAIVMGLVFLFVGPAFLTSLAPLGTINGMASSVVAGAIGVVGILAIAVGIFDIFVGRGLWQHKNWARIVTLVFSVLGILGILSLNILSAAIGGVGLWLFGFEPTVVGLFGAKPLNAKK